MNAKELRTALKLTQNQMAERLGISRETYWKIEKTGKASKPVQKLLDLEEITALAAPTVNP